MISLPQPPVDLGSMNPKNFGRRMTFRYAALLTAMAIVVAAEYLMFAGASEAARSAATAIALTRDEAMLSQRIASLAAQLALGNPSVRPDLQTSIDRFEGTHAQLIAGDDVQGFGSVLSDPALKAIYFGGPAPLDVVGTQFVTRARRIAAMSPRDAAGQAQSEPLFRSAQRPLLEKLDAAVRVREDHAAARTDLWQAVEATLGTALLALLFFAGLALFRPMARQIVDLLREVQQLAQSATLDPVTGMLNRRSFHARGAIEVQKARRYGRPLSVLLIDADQLPTIADTYGPDGGLSVLRALTSSVFAGTRVCDLVARVDAEQFAILLPETNRDGAVLLAERLRQRISDLAVPIADTHVSCTVSIGVAVAEKDAAFLWPTFKRADEALYEAKVRGRNQVFAAAA